MAEALKHFFDERLVRLRPSSRASTRRFAAADLVSLCLDRLGALGLMQRAWRIAEPMHATLPEPFPDATDLLIRSLGPELASAEKFGMAPFRYLPCIYFVQAHGLEHFDVHDIAKDHPDRVIAICKRWLTDAPSGRRWIVNHALRSLVKSTHSGALHLVGAGAAARVRIARVELVPRRVKPGGAVRFAFDLVSTAARAQRVLIDYAVHFVKADGKPCAKVFRLRRLELPPKATLRLSGQVSFADLTTRRQYPGAHRIEVLINGSSRRLGSVDLY